MQLPDDFDPIAVDRAIRRTQETSALWRLRLKDHANPNDDPFQLTRPFLGITAYQQVLSLPDQDPGRTAYQRWTFRLMQERINHSAETRHAFLRYRETHSLQDPEPYPLSCSELLHNLLANKEQRTDWLEALAPVSGATSTAFSHLWQRRLEVSRRLKLQSPDDIELPSERTPAIADDVLLTTSDARDSLGELNSERWLDTSLGSEATRGWPTKLSERHIASWFREARFLEGLDINTGPLPTCYGAASYLRVLELLGAAFRRAIAPKIHSFVVCHDPYGLEEQTYAWIFARLLTNPAFIQRRLGIDRRNQDDHLRILHNALLFEARSRAVKVRLREPAHQGVASFREAFEHDMHEHIGWHVSQDLAGVLLRPTANAGQALAAVVLGEQKYRSLVQEQDEDWFRNPRAIDQMRSEGLRIPNCKVEPEEWPCVKTTLAPLLSRIG